MSEPSGPSLSGLPEELKKHILGFLPAKDMVKCRKLNKHFKELLDREAFHITKRICDSARASLTNQIARVMNFEGGDFIIVLARFTNHRSIEGHPLYNLPIADWVCRYVEFHNVSPEGVNDFMGGWEAFWFGLMELPQDGDIEEWKATGQISAACADDLLEYRREGLVAIQAMIDKWRGILFPTNLVTPDEELLASDVCRRFQEILMDLGPCDNCLASSDSVFHADYVDKTDQEEMKIWYPLHPISEEVIPSSQGQSRRPAYSTLRRLTNSLSLPEIPGRTLYGFLVRSRTIHKLARAYARRHNQHKPRPYVCAAILEDMYFF